MWRTEAILPSVFCICAFSLLSRVGMAESGTVGRKIERDGETAFGWVERGEEGQQANST